MCIPFPASGTVDDSMTTKIKQSTDSPQAPPFTIVCISDTHELHREVEVPTADLLIHPGDFTMLSKSVAAILDFNQWLGELPHRYKVVIPGNHEFFLEADPDKRKLISNAAVLINQGLEVMGLKLWGSPTTPLYGGAFGLSSEKDRIKLYSTIPDDVDILITHGPPYGILDRAPDSQDHAGCRPLLSAVHRVKPRLHIFGHVHEGYGTFATSDMLSANAALLGRNGAIANRPIVFRLSGV
jgi:Icc-related predicted phosphoesterase